MTFENLIQSHKIMKVQKTYDVTKKDFDQILEVASTCNTKEHSKFFCGDSDKIIWLQFHQIFFQWVFNKR